MLVAIFVLRTIGHAAIWAGIGYHVGGILAAIADIGPPSWTTAAVSAAIAVLHHADRQAKETSKP